MVANYFSQCLWQRSDQVYFPWLHEQMSLKLSSSYMLCSYYRCTAFYNPDIFSTFEAVASQHLVRFCTETNCPIRSRRISEFPGVLKLFLLHPILEFGQNRRYNMPIVTLNNHNSMQS